MAVGKTITFLQQRITEKRYQLRFKNLSAEYQQADYMFLSYPKSGRTWIRYLLGEYLHLLYGVKNTHRLNGVYETGSVPERKTKGCPLISFTHDFHSFEGEIDKEKFNDIVQSNQFLFDNFYAEIPMLFLVRDPIDCAVSYYWMQFYMNKFIGSIEEWFLSYEYGLENIKIWFDLMLQTWEKVSNKLTVNYLDLYEKSSWIKMFDFMSIPLNIEELENLLIKHSFDNKKNEEMENKNITNPNSNRLFVRKGQKNYITELPESIQIKIQQDKHLQDIIKCVASMA